MKSPEDLVAGLATSVLGRFPAAMEGPLVGAGLLLAGEVDFLNVTTNIMQLRPNTGYDVVHAEEALLARTLVPAELGERDVTRLRQIADRSSKTDLASVRGELESLVYRIRARECARRIESELRARQEEQEHGS